MPYAAAGDSSLPDRVHPGEQTCREQWAQPAPQVSTSGALGGITAGHGGGGSSFPSFRLLQQIFHPDFVRCTFPSDALMCWGCRQNVFIWKSVFCLPDFRKMASKKLFKSNWDLLGKVASYTNFVLLVLKLRKLRKSVGVDGNSWSSPDRTSKEEQSGSASLLTNLSSLLFQRR